MLRVNNWLNIRLLQPWNFSSSINHLDSATLFPIHKHYSNSIIALSTHTDFLTARAFAKRLPIFRRSSRLKELIRLLAIVLKYPSGYLCARFCAASLCFALMQHSVSHVQLTS